VARGTTAIIAAIRIAKKLLLLFMPAIVAERRNAGASWNRTMGPVG
jgi:hypothetical protein